jgi:hypothetical protein
MIEVNNFIQYRVITPFRGRIREDIFERGAFLMPERPTLICGFTEISSL